MPLTSTSVQTNLKEFMGGERYAKMLKKSGKQTAMKIALGAAYSAARKAGAKIPKYEHGNKFISTEGGTMKEGKPHEKGGVALTTEEGKKVGEMEKGERIFSVEATEKMEQLAEDKKYEALGKFVAVEIREQDERDIEMEGEYMQEGGKHTEEEKKKFLPTKKTGAGFVPKVWVTPYGTYHRSVVDKDFNVILDETGLGKIEEITKEVYDSYPGTELSDPEKPTGAKYKIITKPPVSTPRFRIKTYEYGGKPKYLKQGGKVFWIQGAIRKKKGVLRKKAKAMGLIKGDEKLSATDIEKVRKLGGVWAKRAALAKTLSKFK